MFGIGLPAPAAVLEVVLPLPSRHEVEDVDQPEEHRVLGGFDEPAVEVAVQLADRFLRRDRSLPLVEATPQLLDVRLVVPSAGKPYRFDLLDAPHLRRLVDLVA